MTTLTLNPAPAIRARRENRRLVDAYETTLRARGIAWEYAQGMTTPAARADVLEQLATLEEHSSAAALAAWPNAKNDHQHAARLMRLLAAFDRATPDDDLAMLAWHGGARPAEVTLWEDLKHTSDLGERAQIMLELAELPETTKNYGTAAGILRHYVRELLAPDLYRAELQAEQAHRVRVFLADRIAWAWAFGLLLLAYRGPADLVKPAIVTGLLVVLAIRFNLCARAWRFWVPLSALTKGALALGSCAFAIWSWTTTPGALAQGCVLALVAVAFGLGRAARYLRSRKAR